jgi:hypothetical protein
MFSIECAALVVRYGDCVSSSSNKIQNKKIKVWQWRHVSSWRLEAMQYYFRGVFTMPPSRARYFPGAETAPTNFVVNK